MKRLISASITDFPLMIPLERFFKEFKAAGCDGIELVMGIKSRFNPEYVWSLSQKYDLPILSVHQPAWSGLDIYFDEGFIKESSRRGVKNIVFHSLVFPELSSNHMKKYFEKLAVMQERYGITVLLENAPRFPSNTVIDYFVPDQGNKASLEHLWKIAETYNFGLTYDCSHTRYNAPHLEKEFQHILPRLGNIHLSSFLSTQEHLPLYLGKFDTKGFLSYLDQHHYKGLLTFEIFYPKLFPLGNVYDFSSIEKSVAIVRG